EGAGGDDRRPLAHGVLSKPHDRTLAELLLDLGERDVEHLVAFHAWNLLQQPGPPHRSNGPVLFPELTAPDSSGRLRHNLHPCDSWIERASGYPNRRSGSSTAPDSSASRRTEPPRAPRTWSPAWTAGSGRGPTSRRRTRGRTRPCRGTPARTRRAPSASGAGPRPGAA